MGKPLALNVGCGTRHADFEGYETKNVDLRSEVKPDLIANITELPYRAGEIGLIHLSHVLEHFTGTDGRKLLRYYHALLARPGGKLWIVVPNLEFAALQILRDGAPNPTTMDILYGHQEYETNFHKTGFTPRSLTDFIERLGLWKIISSEERLDGFEISLKAEALDVTLGWKPDGRFLPVAVDAPAEKK